MESRASLYILVLLLGFSQAFYFTQPEEVDITTRILSTNKGFSEPLLEGDIHVKRSRTAVICTNNNCYWKKSPNGLVEVPYILSSAFSSSDKTVITNAMSSFHNKTCIRFISRTNQTDYLSIKSNAACYSDVGKSGGAQVVSLSQLGCIYYGVVQHELNHALGFYHEHVRSDRDNYVTINWNNMDPTMTSNFNLKNTNNLNTPYDYSSVMHYGRTAFSINGLDTITPIPNPKVKIGQRQELSTIDVRRINTLYKC
ncbi:hatching enzyme 1b precursor [Silurus asotus]|uniref:Metalloendopeptidase n=1 Tax=Silurus asotus TaxID=30991 RepID=A0AAD5AZF1_SILAS|nr:hatching enzyme 1b precursor [Silurus asotus]